MLKVVTTRAWKVLSLLLGAIVAILAAPLQLVRGRVRLLHLAEKLPGPPALPIFGNALGPKSSKPKDIFDYGIYLAKKYGRIARYYMGPTLFIYVGHTSDLEIFLTGQQFITKSFMYRFLQPWLGLGLATSTGEKWRQRRKALTPAFHFRILEQFVPVFHSCGDEFLRLLRQRAGGEAFDVLPLAKLLTLDIICETAMGVKIKAQIDSNSDYVNAVNQISTMTSSRMFQPWYYPDFIYFNSPVGRKYKKYLDVIHGHTDKVIRQRKIELDNMEEKSALDIDDIGQRRRVAFLDLVLLTARDGSMSDQDVRDEVETIMFGGHDTTSVTMSYTFFLLSRHQDVQDKVVSELESTFDASDTINPTTHHLSELTYMEMVIKECLRLYPPVSVMNRYLSEDTEISSRPLLLPKGANVSFSPFLVHRDPELFPDPERFDPERFSAQESARRHPFAFIPFSAGPRNCIGQRFAMMEMKTLLAKVLWSFRFLPAQGYKPALTWNLILLPENGVSVMVERRR